MSEKKPNYTIGQVADYFDLPQSVLRYWETVFDVLNPEKSAGGIRQYSDRDLKIISEIKHLLYQRGFTIKGANNLLNQKYHIQKSDLPVKTKIRKK
ncbi:MAG TPA: MerR family transcriptional regulator, partial [Caldithrix abyssi]|nr:MerR family transcriptional regulator [Caldithrix abyssi]